MRMPDHPNIERVVAMHNHSEIIFNIAFSDILSVYRKHEGGAVFSISEIQHERFYQQLRYSQIVFPEFSNYLKYPIGEKCFHLSLKTLRHLKLPKFCYWFFLSFYYSPRAFFDSLFKLFF